MHVLCVQRNFKFQVYNILQAYFTTVTVHSTLTSFLLWTRWLLLYGPIFFLILQKSVTLANDLYFKETDSGCCFDHHVNDSCLYYPSEFDFELKCNSRFARNVSFNYSAIHIPTDIYENGKIALYQYTSCLHTYMFCCVL